MDGVDQTQTVLFQTNVWSQNKRVPTHAAHVFDILIREPSYPEHLRVVQSGHQHQALGGEDLS